jgi:mono/diheme cytochrome c family protein
MRRSGVGLLLALVAIAGCGSARRGAPYAREPTLTPRQQQGEIVFMHNCNPCHPGGAGGLGPALNNKPLPPGVVRLQVREGVGDMPSFDERALGEADLTALVEYLGVLRFSPGPR